MIKVYEITLDSEQINYQTGSAFHGVLMEGFSPDFADQVHNSPQNPYSQYLYKNGSYWIWRINALTPEASNEIEKFVGSLGKSVFLANKQAEIPVLKIENTANTSFEKLIAKAYSGERLQSQFELEFKTPTSFKSEGAYQIFPSSEWIMKSLITKFNAGALNFTLTDTDIVRDVCQGVSISAYRLRSTRFYLEKVKVPSFIGSVTLSVNGPNRLKELASLLLSTAEYTGIGIKNSLGMGGVYVSEPKTR